MFLCHPQHWPCSCTLLARQVLTYLPKMPAKGSDLLPCSRGATGVCHHMLETSSSFPCDTGLLLRFLQAFTKHLGCSLLLVWGLGQFFVVLFTTGASGIPWAQAPRHLLRDRCWRVLGTQRVPQPRRPWRGAHRPDPLPILQVVAEEEEEEDASGPWEPECTGKGSPGSGPEADSSSRRGMTEPGSNPVCGEQEEEEDDEEEEGSCCSEEGEDGSNVYFYYTIGERWIDYLQRTEDGGLLRHARPKVTAGGWGLLGCSGPGHGLGGFLRDMGAVVAQCRAVAGALVTGATDPRPPPWAG